MPSFVRLHGIFIINAFPITFLSPQQTDNDVHALNTPLLIFNVMTVRSQFHVRYEMIGFLVATDSYVLCIIC